MTEAAQEAAAPQEPPPAPVTGEAVCPRCGAPPSPGPWCMACGAAFSAAPAEGSVPAGPQVEARKFACDGCAALMLWDADAKAMRCPFCGGSKCVEVDAAYVAVENALENAPVAKRRQEAPRVLECDRCGAKVAVPEHASALSCTFCGSEHVLERKGDPDRIRPASVVPFAIGLEAARARWKQWLGKGLFRPRALRDSASVEGLKGVYLPFWTYDTRTWSRWTAMAGYRYTVTVGTGQNRRTETRTRWVPASGERRDVYDDVLVCASKGVEERRLEKTYPYHLKDAAAYRSEFLSGWAAEEYAVDLPQGWGRAREKVNQDQVSKCGGDVPGDTHMNLRVWTQHAGVTWKHLLLPLWIATYFYREKRFHFLVNGQTGKVAGTAPISWIKVSVAVLIAAALAALIYFLWPRR